LVNKRELSKTLSLNIATVDKYLYVMEKSYSIAFSKPFWSNVRKELIKMPKVYFLDLGLRNSLLDTFENITNRLDKGQFFENIVWRECVFKY
jgi:predicted AAA+ superfamily ATPase